MKIYHQYKDILYNSSLRILNNRQDAEDAVQEAFLKGFKKIHRIKDHSNLKSWFTRIVINHSIDVLRKRKQLETNIIEMPEIEDQDTYVEEHNISIDIIQKCLNRLDNKYRIVLTLFLIENYTHKEISKELRLNESTVRSQYKRGKNKLINLLNEYK